MGNPSKNIYVLMMSLILLMGCLGGTTTSGNEGDAEDSGTTVINNYYNNSTPNLPPIIAVGAELLIVNYHPATDQIVSVDLFVHHAMTDWDGSITNAGWDWNLDGTIDMVVTDATDYYTITVPASALSFVQENVIANIVFGAVDDDGAWASSEILTITETDDSYGTGNIYVAEDASGAISADTDDTLIKIRWAQAGTSLNWAFVTLKLEVGDNLYDCSVQSGQECSITQDGSDSGVWETNEFIQLHESGTEICGAAGVSCTVNIYVMYDGYTVVGTQTVTLS